MRNPTVSLPVLFSFVLFRGVVGCASAADPSGSTQLLAQPDAAAVADARSPDGSCTGAHDAASMADAVAPADGVGPPVDAAPAAGDAGSDAGSAGSGSAAGCALSFTGTLATWSFAGDPGSQPSTAAASTAAGIAAGAISRSSALSARDGSGSINSSDWATTAAADATRYYTFSIAPPSGCAMDLTGLSIAADASASGPTSAVVATSADDFAAKAAVATKAASSPALSVTDATEPIEIRVYGFAAKSTAGTMRLDATLSVAGGLH